MHTDSENYKRYVNARAKKSPLAKNCVRAFLTGGAICAGAQGLLTLYKSRGMEKDDAAALVSVSLVFLTALLTGLGVFDNIAKWAGAGTLVPITGFRPRHRYQRRGIRFGRRRKDLLHRRSRHPVRHGRRHGLRRHLLDHPNVFLR